MAKPSLPKIPYLSIPDVPLVSTTQNVMPIADIIDDIVLFKDGGAAMVMESTSLNFGLLSEREQEAVIAAYAALINSLSFAIQIVIRTQRKDVTKYIRYLDEAQAKLDNPKLSDLLAGYKKFVVETTRRRNVLGKRFFLVIPFSSYEVGVTSSFKAFASTKKGPLPYTKEYMLNKAKISLAPKREHLSRQAARLGLKLKPLRREQLIDLYYHVYNPDRETVKQKEEVKEGEEL